MNANPVKLHQGVDGQAGLALVLILALLLTVFTATVITHLSLNKAGQQRVQNSTQALTVVRNALVAYALMDSHPGMPAFNPRLQPPGTLPCPSANRQGAPAVNGAGSCTLQRGFVPYRALGIPEPLDGAGGPLWYAVATSLTGNSNPPLVKRNSSTATNLKVRSSATNQTNLVAFVVLAANQPVSGQTSAVALPSNASDFLEGINAQANTSIYEDLRDAHHNDQLVAVPLGEFWSQVEKRVLLLVRPSIVAYRATCGRYPWPTSFGSGGVSQPNTYAGGVPFSPADWAACGTPPQTVAAPAPWISDHWSQLLYYAICNDPAANPPNAPAAKCLVINEPAGPTTNAFAVLLAPGIELSSQNRSLPAVANFFESLGQSNTLTTLPASRHTGSYNDVLLIIE